MRGCRTTRGCNMGMIQPHARSYLSRSTWRRQWSISKSVHSFKTSSFLSLHAMTCQPASTITVLMCLVSWIYLLLCRPLDSDLSGSCLKVLYKPFNKQPRYSLLSYLCSPVLRYKRTTQFTSLRSIHTFLDSSPLFLKLVTRMYIDGGWWRS